VLLSGPVNTMLLNGREVGRAVMCSFDLAFNQTKTYMSLRIVPIIDILYQLQVGALAARFQRYSLQCFDAVGWAAGRASGL